MWEDRSLLTGEEKPKTKVAKGQGDRGDTWALSLLVPRTVHVGSMIVTTNRFIKANEVAGGKVGIE
jgi:hypothetical protein